MPKYDYQGLQNGSDIRGVAISGVSGEDVNLNSETCDRLAKGFLCWLSNKTGKDPSVIKISVGRDSRISGPEIYGSVSSALQHCGVTVMNADLASTPAMFMSTVFPEYNCDGAIMITASHLPFNRNGMKFFDKEGGLDKGDITDIIVFAESDSTLAKLKPSEPKDIIPISLIDTYSEHLRIMIIEGVNHPTNHLKPLTGLSVTVDAGNGAGGFYASKVLSPLGADVSSSQFLEPDGTFPNHAPNPENIDAMNSICSKVLSSHTDLGIIFDTDVDRSSAVDEKGHEISRNGIIAMAASLVASNNPGTTIVTDSITSTQLSEFLEKNLSLRHLRFKRGYRNVINKAKELNALGDDCQLAIETSGHAAYKENYFLDDGAYLATKIVIKSARLKLDGLGISSVIAHMAVPAESEEVRFPITSEDFSSYADTVISYLENLVSAGNLKGASLVTPNFEGVRIAFDTPVFSGWMLLRKSLHDPIMPLNIESDEPGGCMEIRKVLRPILSAFHELDISKL